MKFCIDKSVFDGKSFLLIDENLNTRKTLQNPAFKEKGVIFYGTEEFDKIVKLFSSHDKRISFPSEEYRKTFNNLVKNKKYIPWRYCIPQEIYQKQLTNLIDDIKELQVHFNENYYKHFKKTEKVFDLLQSSKVDIVNFIKTKNSCVVESQKVFLQSFSPDQKGFTKVPQYSRVDTRTGRIKIISGPNILHLNKKYRNIITSRHKENGSIFYLDFKSLEPRVLLAISRIKDANSTIGYDIYEEVLKNLNLNVPREIVKISLLSHLYGQEKNKTAMQIKKHVEHPNDFLDMIDDYFQIENTKKKLQKEFEKNGYIKNFFGRAIFPEDKYLLLNYFIQSTSVDVALDGFNNITNKLKDINALQYVTPIFILHDALLLDVHKNFEKFIPKICNLGETITSLNKFKFYIESTKVE